MAYVTPTPTDVAAYIPRRFREPGGTYSAVPTALTSPTAAQVTRIITDQEALVLAATGNLSALSCGGGETNVWAAAAGVVAQRAAIVVERSFWPEEIADNRDIAAEWRTIVESDQAAVVQAARECAAGEIEPGGDEGSPVDIAPVFSFETQTQRISF